MILRFCHSYIWFGRFLEIMMWFEIFLQWLEVFYLGALGPSKLTHGNVFSRGLKFSFTRTFKTLGWVVEILLLGRAGSLPSYARILSGLI